EELARDMSRDPILADTTVLLEPGRFLVGPAGVYVTRVVDVKDAVGHRVAILDGGINHFARPALVRQHHRVRHLLTGSASRNGHGTGLVSLAGPLCTGLDVLSEPLQLGSVKRGDLVAFLDAG